ncbi:MAG: hypothetical protein WC873_03075 [Candidatus Gracilibacteria bacterium]
MKSLLKGVLAAAVLLAIYFLILSLVSGWSFAVDQFSQFWYFIVSLAAGFGLQVGLYTYLKGLIVARSMGKGVLVATGSTSTVAMISCCAHYLVNILPVLGVTGLVAVVAQYQVDLFWVAIFFNLLGIVYISSKIYEFKKEQKDAA